MVSRIISADDAQIFFSFSPSDPDFSSHISTCLSAISLLDALASSQPPPPISLSLFLLNLQPSLPPHPPRTSVSPSTPPSLTLSTSLLWHTPVSSSLATYAEFAPSSPTTPYSGLVQVLVLSLLDTATPSCPASLPLSSVRSSSSKTLLLSLSFSFLISPTLHRCSALCTDSLLLLASNSKLSYSPIAVLTFLLPPISRPSFLPTPPLTPCSSTTGRFVVPLLHSPASRAHSFSTLAPQWWNVLPTNIRTSQSLTTFQHLLKNTPVQTASLNPTTFDYTGLHGTQLYQYLHQLVLALNCSIPCRIPLLLLIITTSCILYLTLLL
ncbi:UNVERIFIED_CONTAM: hypothetical protein FKN15_064351 [Acipenser sinensis]